MKKIEASQIADGTTAFRDGKVAGFNSTPQGELLFAIARNPLDYREESGIGSFAKTKTDKGQVYDIYLAVDGDLHLLTTIASEFNFHTLQLLNAHELLMVCARSRYRSQEDYEKNGKIYSLDGQLKTEILLGDGIQDVQANSNGNIWTSYFDEGVFGNYGWHTPVGQNGLIAWNAEGEKRYEFYPIDPLDFICDCYALNVSSNNEAWCYYYTDFPLVRIRDYKIVDYWHIPVGGSSAFAIYQNFALFSGGYNEETTALHLLKLNDNNRATEVSRIQLENVSNVERIIGRGNALYLLSNRKAYVTFVEELL